MIRTYVILAFAAFAPSRVCFTAATLFLILVFYERAELCFPSRVEFNPVLLLELDPTILMSAFDWVLGLSLAGSGDFLLTSIAAFGLMA